MTIRHALDGVELVASLVRHDPGLVGLWRSESHIPGLGDGVKPDQLVVIDTGDGSAWILVEVDESTERPPVIRERLKAYAELFVKYPTGWHLLWVTNSPERLARLRQIAGPMKLAALASRCWGVPIGEVSELGASAQVLAVGASLPPRPLRAIATDPKARRTSYPVGSPAWVRLLANGGLEDISGLWQGVERGAGVRVQERAVAGLAASAQDHPEAPQASVQSSAGPPSPESTATEPDTLEAAELNSDIALMLPGELVRVILDASAAQSRIEQAVELLAERDNWYYLIEALERLCKSGESRRQIEGVRFVRRMAPSANDWFRRQCRALLLEMVDPHNPGDVIDFALASLDETATG